MTATAGALALLVLVSAVFVVTLGNLFRAALSLGLVLVGVAGLFVVLGAEFLAFSQILIYVGAILTLVVFAIMLTAKLSSPAAPLGFHQRLPAAAASLALFVLLALATEALVPTTMTVPKPVTTAQLGRELITRLVLAFEVISLVFVASMVGAIAVAHSKTRLRAPR